MDIIIVHPGNPEDVPSEHLGIASLKAFIAQYGFTVDTLDLTLENLDIQDAVRILHDQQPGCIGISMLDQTKGRGLALIEELRCSGFHGPIIIGGYFPTFHANELLENIAAIDFVVRGEGEYTLLDLMCHLAGRSKKSLAEINGLSYRSGGRVFHTTPRPLIHDLDSLPMVDRKYAQTVIKKTGHLRVYASRGCWGHCSFCDINSFYTSSPGRRWRSRSISKFVDELEHLGRTLHCHYFILNDDNFMTRGLHNRERARRLAEEITNRNLSLRFEMMCRADSVDRQALSYLKRSGLQRVFLGIESFDQDHLDRFGKGTTVRQNLKAIIRLKQMKIDCIISLILADAFTRLRTLIKQYYVLFIMQRKFFNSSNCKISINERLELYRGSDLYRQYKQAGLLTRDHWLDGYNFRLKRLTAWRLYMARLEKKIYHNLSTRGKKRIKDLRFKPLANTKKELKPQLVNIQKNDV
jgi:anaerobic magnesium-protoporphyrin IX monomethyl ester cyclase